MDSSLAIIERNDSFAIIRLNRPKTRDALSREMIGTLSHTFKNLESQPQLRAIILTWSGDSVSPAETDIAETADLTQADVGKDNQEGLYDKIEKCTVPVIAAIDGLSAGDWFELALACHLRIASPGASFSLSEARLGPIGRQSTVHRLAREVGTDRAREISQSGRTVLAEEAVRIGLINRVAPESRLLNEAESLAKQISTMAPLAIRACLEAVTRGIELPLAEGLAWEAQLFASLFATNDVREGTSAFLEKRHPVFKGS